MNGDDIMDVYSDQQQKVSHQKYGYFCNEESKIRVHPLKQTDMNKRPVDGLVNGQMKYCNLVIKLWDMSISCFETKPSVPFGWFD